MGIKEFHGSHVDTDAHESATKLFGQNKTVVNIGDQVSPLLVGL